MVIGKEKGAAQHGATPLACVAEAGVAACDPQIMGRRRRPHAGGRR
jgi:hypothetical protein